MSIDSELIDSERSAAFSDFPQDEGFEVIYVLILCLFLGTAPTSRPLDLAVAVSRVKSPISQGIQRSRNQIIYCLRPPTCYMIRRAIDCLLVFSSRSPGTATD